MTDLFTNVVRASFYGGIVIAAVCLLRLALKRAPRSMICLLWLLAGLRLVMPFEIESRFSLQPELDPVRQEWVQSETADFGESWGEILDRTGEILVEKPLASTEETSETSWGEILDSQGEILASKPLASGEEEPPKIDYETLIPPLWLAGMAAMLLFSVASCRKLKRTVREAWLTGDGCWECDRIETAFVLGFLRPRIYLPVGLGDREREFILAHEQTHIQRRDHLWKLAGYVILAIHWFNPLVWLAYSLLCRDIELACDEQVVKNMTIEQRKAYSGALLSCAAKHGRFAACPVAFGETDVKGRIKNVLDYKKPGFWITVFALFAAVFVAVCLMTSPKAEQTDNQMETVPAEWMAECQSVLETTQGRDAYSILELIQVDGREITRNSFRYGDYWLRIDQLQDEVGEFSGYMGLGGTYYDAVCDDLDFEWQQVDMTRDAIFDPWLYSFDIVANKTTALSREETEEGYTIRLLVEAPYQIGLSVADSYYVDFCFDRDGDFLRATQYVVAQEIINGKIEYATMVKEMIVHNDSGQNILDTIRQYAGSVQKELDIYLGVAEVEQELEEMEQRYCMEEGCTDASHDHSARDCTEPDCTDASHGHSHHDHH